MTKKTAFFHTFPMISVLVVLLMCAAVQSFAAPMEKEPAPFEQTDPQPFQPAPDNGIGSQDQSDPIDIAAGITADLIGIRLDALWEAVDGGQSIAEIATAGGVDPRTIIDALWAWIQSEIEAELAGGAITAEEAAQWLAVGKPTVAEFVNGSIKPEIECSEDDEFLYEFLALVGDLLDMEEDAVWEALESGQTVAQLAEERGADPQTIIDAIVADARAEIDSELAGGTVTAEEAASLLAEVELETTALVNEPIEWDDDPLEEAVALFVELSGMEEDAVWEALESGQTLEQLAEAQSVDPLTIVDAIVADARAEIDSELAGGILTAEEAASLLAEVELEATALVNEPIGWDDEWDDALIEEMAE